MLRLFSTSIVRQIVAITLCLLAVSTAAIVGATYYNLSRYVMDGAVSDARDATRAMAVLYGAADQGARVELKDNQLATVTEDAIPALADHSLVDRTAQSIAGVATIFQKQGGDYVRISTNVKKENGDRAVGTKLVAEHPAQPVLARGEAYYGPAELFGRKFMAWLPESAPSALTKSSWCRSCHNRSAPISASEWRSATEPLSRRTSSAE